MEERRDEAMEPLETVPAEPDAERAKAASWSGLGLPAGLAALGAAAAWLLRGTDGMGPLDLLAGFGRWLRELSLSGVPGDIAAWALALGVSALPALGLLWRKGRRRRWLLVLAMGQVFFGLYFLVNPSLLGIGVDVPLEEIWGLTALWAVGATMLAWAALGLLDRLGEMVAPGSALERLLHWAAGVLAALAGFDCCQGAMASYAQIAQGNTVVPEGAGILLAVLAVLELIPTLLACQVLLWGAELARALESDPFGAETVALAETVAKRCAGVTAASVLVCVSGNLVQMVWFSVLRSIHVTLTFPFLTLALSAALSLLCRYFRRAKAVSDDNGTII